MTIDQKDILKPLLQCVWDFCLSKQDLFLRVAGFFEELLYYECCLLIVYCMRYKQQVTISDNRSKDETNLANILSMDLTSIDIYENIEFKMLGYLQAQDQMISS